jgi:predicted metal-dependent enzyme (double-stranded beta helix superfamily)
MTPIEPQPQSPSIFEVTGIGHCQVAPPCQLPDRSPYRLYRFLSDVDDVLETIPDDLGRVRAIAPLVHHLLTESDWLTLEHLPPDPKKGWSVLMLYKEPDYPLTIQTVVWEPGRRSPIHNHATWGIVAIIDGDEKNILWQRTDGKKQAGKAQISRVEEKVLEPGDIICFTSDAIHCVEAVSQEPTITFNVYGVTDFPKRLRFDPGTATAKNF